MRKHMVFLPIVTLFFCSCSIIIKVPVLKPEKQSAWRKAEVCHSYYLANLSLPAYKFQNDSISISLFPCPKPGTNIMIGPPFVPIMPNLFSLFPGHSGSNENFFVDFKVVNQRASALNFDFALINFRQKKEDLVPTKVIEINSASYGFSNSMIGTQLEESKSFSDERKVIKINPSDSIFVRCEFIKLTTEVKQLSVKIESFSNQIPPLELRTKNNYSYVSAYHD